MKMIDRLYTEQFKKVRVDSKTGRPDPKDIREVRMNIDGKGDSDARMVRDAMKEAHLALTGGRVLRRTGSPVRPGSASLSSVAPSQVRDVCMSRNGTVSPAALRDSPMACITDEIPCHADILGATSFDSPNFPLVGGVTPTEGSFAVSPSATAWYKPAFMFWEARDVEADFGQVFALLTRAVVLQYPQLSSSGVAGGISSSAFSVDTPLDVRKFAPFSNTQNNQLTLTIANVLGASTEIHVCCVFWGDNLGNDQPVGP